MGERGRREGRVEVGYALLVIELNFPCLDILLEVLLITRLLVLVVSVGFSMWRCYPQRPALAGGRFGLTRWMEG